ncbi:MafB family polymorphic toxin [Acinetobacter pollinis]|uniref:MafB family polymorphic toxin n=2 Tax=Acinetobacter pollinis TaxID=2605270 RepID=UPI0018A262C3|nr:MafB family polymorphic toxin [Acinetobacter pollinis]MBF7699057.1 MafB family polymorphic toxin [Acinetobacter pollinis]
MIQRGIVLFLLSVLTVITQVFAGSLTNDPFVQSSIDRSNFEPGGQYHLFGAPRGGTTDREGRINVLPVYDQQFGSLRLENVVVDGDITYNTRFSGHHWDEHAPFSETSSQSKSTEEGSIADGFTVLKLNWSGTKVHPADGYDGEQGGGYPVPTGARDEYHYTINGNAQRISLQLNDQRSTSQRFLDRFSQAGKDFVDGANQSHDKFFIHDPKLNTWGNIAQGFNGLVDAALSPLRPISDLLGVHDAADGLSALSGYSTLAGMSELSADGKGSAIDALAVANGFKNDIIDAAHDWALNHPNSLEGIGVATVIVPPQLATGIKEGTTIADAVSAKPLRPQVPIDTPISKETPVTPSHTFPDEVFSGKAPKQTEPGNTTRLQERYNPHTGQLEESIITYDEYGRMKERVDYTDHGYAKGKNKHSDPHIHYYEYSSNTPGGKETRVNLDESK